MVDGWFAFAVNSHFTDLLKDLEASGGHFIYVTYILDTQPNMYNYNVHNTAHLHNIVQDSTHSFCSTCATVKKGFKSVPPMKLHNISFIFMQVRQGKSKGSGQQTPNHASIIFDIA